MTSGLIFIFNNVLLGLGLAMDAFSVSMANGMNEPNMKNSKLLLIAMVFGGFQGVMPFIGWACVNMILEYFTVFERFIPWIALILLGIIGVGMIKEGVNTKKEGKDKISLGVGGLIIQGVATSIDALSVGFAISEYNLLMALLSIAIISVVTLAVCIVGLEVGKKFGMALSNKAQIFGGLILIIIGIEIFVMGITK